MLTACSGDAIVDDTPVADKEQVQITFTINMGGSSTRTRANTWGDNLDSDETNDYKYQKGTNYENTIEEGKLQVLLFNTDNTFIGELENISYNRHSDDDNIYDIIGSLSVDKATVSDGKLECKIVVLANYDDKASEVSNLSDISTLTFNYDSNYIPMYGVETYSGYNAIKLSAGSWSSIGTIYMLRAMAKIRVRCNDIISLTSVSVSNYNTKGNIVPQGYTETSTRNIDYENNTFNPCTDCKEEDESLSFKGTEVEDGKTYWYVYLPEMTSSNNSKITVTYTYNNNEQTKTFSIGEYTKGSLTGNIDVVRNHVYSFYLNKRIEVELELKYQAIDWTSGSGTVEFE